MRFSGSRTSAERQLDIGGAQPLSTFETKRGNNVDRVKAGRDPVAPPTDPAYVAVIERGLCRVAIGEDCYVVTGVGGGQRAVRYGAPLSDWERVCGELLNEAMKQGMV